MISRFQAGMKKRSICSGVAWLSSVGRNIPRWRSKGSGLSGCTHLGHAAQEGWRGRGGKWRRKAGGDMGTKKKAKQGDGKLNTHVSTDGWGERGAYRACYQWKRRIWRRGGRGQNDKRSCKRVARAWQRQTACEHIMQIETVDLITRSPKLSLKLYSIKFQRSLFLKVPLSLVKLCQTLQWVWV